jgi:threonyl-tRNA synthetase
MENEKIELQRHSLAHVMAGAVLKLYPQAKFGVGPVIENGFYYDIDLGDTTLSSEDLPKIQKLMKEMIKEKLVFERKEVSLEEAVEIFKAKNQDYKLELLKDLKEKGTTVISDDEKSTGLESGVDQVSIYTTDDFVDLCRGPHVKSTQELKEVAFKLNKLAGAYWRGKEGNPMLTRIYGLAFAEQKELDEYLEFLIEVEKRDHRRIGKDLDLFMIDEEVGAGLPIWLPNGAILRQEMENFILNIYQKRGYQLVRTPHITSYKLFEQSGHLGFYKDSMYSPMDIDGQDYYVKPMNCPMHVKIYNHDLKSYRDLPVRYAELGTVYRYEKSGTLHGLLRVRGFTQDDAHIICSSEQLEDELIKLIDLTKYVLETFGFQNFEVMLSVRDQKNKTKYLGSDQDWELAENSLKKALKKAKLEFKVDEGEAVFYGPKIDIKVKDTIGRTWQISTIQLDFNLPERFQMKYINDHGVEQKPFMIHRALLGSLERFTGVLIEHYAGAFPLWLSPLQVKIISVGGDHIEYCQKLADEFRNNDIRVAVDNLNETVGNKIRKAVAEKVPYMLVIGDREMDSDKLAVRVRGSEKVVEIKQDEFIEGIKEKVKSRSREL